MNKNNLTITIVAAVLVGALGFLGGTQYQKTQRGNFPMGMNQRVGNGDQQARGVTRQGNGNGIRPLSGEIASIDDKMMTIKTQNGNSQIVVFSDSTKINKTQEGSKGDLKVGEQVMVIGISGTDNTVTAQSISLGGDFFRGGLGSNSQP